MKQKIVVKISGHCEKCRSKALKTGAIEDGVISVALEGADKDKLVVIGEKVDAACLTKSLRKKIKYAEIITVEEVKPKPKEEPKEKSKEKITSCCKERPHCELVQVVYDPNPTSCTFM